MNNKVLDFISKIINTKTIKKTESKELNTIFMPAEQFPVPDTMNFLVEEMANDDYYAYFKNGVLYDVKPRNKKISLCDDRQIAYNARYIISDGILYDLKDATSIPKIPIPVYKQKKGIESPTLYLFYIF